MKVAVFVSVLLCSLCARAQPQAFDRYILAIRGHRPQPQLELFAKSCGISSRVSHRYANGGGEWVTTTNLPRSVYEQESDYLGTADVWISSGTPKMIVTWGTDAEEAQEQISCLNSSGRVIRQVIISWFDADRKFDCKVVITRQPDEAGRLVQRSAEFTKSNGSHGALTPDLLEKDSYDFATHYPDIQTLDDFKFPSTFLKSLNMSTHATP